MDARLLGEVHSMLVTPENYSKIVTSEDGY